jgi:hypothetical protein
MRYKITSGKFNQSCCTVLHLGSALALALSRPRFIPALGPPTTPTSSTTRSRNNGSSSIRRRALCSVDKASLTHSCHRLLYQQLSHPADRRETGHPPP